MPARFQEKAVWQFFMNRIIWNFFAGGEGPFGQRPHDPNDPVDPACPVKSFLPLFHWGPVF
jgi:hypothetical protein